MSKSPLRISVVSFLNSRPYLDALKTPSLASIFEISTDIPSECARKLINREVDLGLIPVAMIRSLPTPRILPDYCISADGKVDSVLLVSRVPLKDISTVLLDPSSRTSVQLARILADELWHIHPTWIEADNGTMDLSNPLKTDAAVVIGDRALQFASGFPVVIDLAEEWKRMTGLPFVFAAWVSNGEIDPEDSLRLRQGFKQVEHLEIEFLNTLQKEFPYVDVEEYLTLRIRYRLGEREKEGMKLFLTKLQVREGYSSSLSFMEA